MGSIGPDRQGPSMHCSSTALPKRSSLAEEQAAGPSSCNFFKTFWHNHVNFAKQARACTMAGRSSCAPSRKPRRNSLSTVPSGTSSRSSRMIASCTCTGEGNHAYTRNWRPVRTLQVDPMHSMPRMRAHAPSAPCTRRLPQPTLLINCMCPLMLVPTSLQRVLCRAPHPTCLRPLD